MIVVFPDHTHLYTIFVGVRSTVDILSDHHVGYMNRKGWYSVIMQGEPFSPMFTSDGLDSCTPPGFW